MRYYYNKYLKYKNKYLQLKNQTGGDYTEVDVNHNGKDFKFQVPSSLIDSNGSLDLFIDPVMTSDGQTYERKTIQRWFELGHHTSPNTGAVLREQTLIPNLTLKNVIEEIKNKKITSNDSSYIYTDITYKGITFTIKLPSSFFNENFIFIYPYNECFYDLYNDPVVASDGYTYEREYIEKWLEIFNISPKTGKILVNKNLKINFALKNAFDEIIEKEFSNYDPTYTLVTKRKKRCKNKGLFIYYNEESKLYHIFNSLEKLTEDQQNHIIKNNLSLYDLINTFIHYYNEFIYFDDPIENLPNTIILIKNFLYREHRDIYLYVLNKLEEHDTMYKLSLKQEQEEEELMNRSQKVVVDEKELRKKIFKKK